jgi:hypothetical protein
MIAAFGGGAGGGGAGDGSQQIETPIVVFPLRGRLNPYFWYLLPLLFLSIFAYVSSS